MSTRIDPVLLGKEWMKNVGLIGDYGKDEHTIRNNEQLRVPVMRTGIAAGLRNGSMMRNINAWPHPLDGNRLLRGVTA
ncbi:hypothetical protein N7530_007390 [Penicillium desertorum]|uniref:Uncharacterized protein n=1 Tax=Penicillium desertorum TaxID=1303715 RepID=A0A9X0BK58_9EURO|nr:hypothetical protein N7530_007390 [Penicillium desertorum]